MFHLTTHEWECAEQALLQTFHLWHICDQPRIAVVTLEQVRPHVPDNRGIGKWESAKIPFSAFADEFSVFRAAVSN